MNRNPSKKAQTRLGLSARGRALLLVLLAAALAFALSLPWQKRQWQEAARLRKESQSVQARLDDLQARKRNATLSQQRLSQDPANLQTLLEAVGNFLAQRDLPRAAQLLQELESRYQNDPNLQRTPHLALTLSGLYQQLGWIDRAFFFAQEGLRIAPETPETLIRISFLESLVGWQRPSAEHMKAAQQRAPGTAEIHLALALNHEQAGGLGESEKELRSADRLRPNDPNISLLLARNLISQRRPKEAMEILDRLEARNSANPGTLSARIEALLLAARSQPAASAALLQSAAEAAHTYQRIAPTSQEARFLLGKVLQAQGDTAGAIRLWEQSYAEQPDYPGLQMSLGRLLVRQGQRERGRQMIEAGDRARSESSEYNRLVTLAGMRREDPETHRALARWCMTHNRRPRALFEWEQILQRRPGDTEALRNREICLAERVQFAIVPTPRPQ